MKKVITLFVFVLIGIQYSIAQNALALSISDLMNWQTTTANPANVCSIPISHRVKSPNYQAINGLDTSCQIMYCPDGMNNFGPYVDSSAQFNLFNFSHWQYIDMLVWFGGGAATPIILPSKAWVDAAHKNGVKVVGTIFFAPTVYGGTETAVQNFLQQDVNGNFIAAQKLIQIANYYNFDGWFLNFETPINSTLGALASTFVSTLHSTYSGEVIWYDAMLQNGTISYQNRVNSTNGYFLQHSSGLFTNYNWNTTAVTSSNTYATSVNVSPYRVYMGADMWPSRTAQPAFTNSNWIDRIFTGQTAKTSIALFATNFPFNSSTFSNFNNDPNDYNNFYIAERKIFSGEDQNPFLVDANWKGICNYIPIRSTITSLPFSTDFNTGHGLNYYNQGSVLRAGAWHNMSHQSILPSWTFYNNNINIKYDFTDAFDGGTSLNMVSNTAGRYSIPLYSTAFPTTSNVLKMELALKSLSYLTIDSISIELKKKNSTTTQNIIFSPQYDGTWEDLRIPNVHVGINDTIVEVKLNVYSSGAFSINIGKIGFERGNPLGVSTVSASKPAIVVYPNPSVDGLVHIDCLGDQSGELNIFDLAGQRVYNAIIQKGNSQTIKLPEHNVYIYEFQAGDTLQQGKLIVQ